MRNGSGLQGAVDVAALCGSPDRNLSNPSRRHASKSSFGQTDGGIGDTTALTAARFNLRQTLSAVGPTNQPILTKRAFSPPSLPVFTLFRFPSVSVAQACFGLSFPIHSSVSRQRTARLYSTYRPDNWGTPFSSRQSLLPFVDFNKAPSSTSSRYNKEIGALFLSSPPPSASVLT